MWDRKKKRVKIVMDEEVRGQNCGCIVDRVACIIFYIATTFLSVVLHDFLSMKKIFRNLLCHSMFGR
jgi:hypothetical protein